MAFISLVWSQAGSGLVSGWDTVASPHLEQAAKCMWWAGLPAVPGLWTHHLGIEVLSYLLVNLDLDVAAFASTEGQSSHCI